jgi:hypothetical protein
MNSYRDKEFKLMEDVLLLGINILKKKVYFQISHFW